MTKLVAQPEIVNRAINGALNNLRAAACEFSVRTPDGTIHQTPGFDLKATTPRRPAGSLKAIYAALVDDLPVGGVAVIPCGDIPPEAVRSSVTAYLSYKWGNGSYNSCVHEGSVQILRLLRAFT